MKKWLPAIMTACFAAWLVMSLKPAPDRDGFQLNEFGRLPVLLNGRIQPFDSVARNALLVIHGTQTVRPPADEPAARTERTLSAMEWMMEVMLRPEKAEQRKIFRIENIDLRNLLGARAGRLGQASIEDLRPKFEELLQQAREADKKEAQVRNGYEKDILHLYQSLSLYQKLQNILQSRATTDLAAELAEYKKAIATGLPALMKAEKGEEPKQREELDLLVGFFHRYREMADYSYALIVPPLNPSQGRDNWTSMGASLMEAMRSNDIPPAVNYFAKMAGAYRNDRAADFNRTVSEYRQWLASQNLVPELKKGNREFVFNHVEPFYKSMLIYVCALLCGCAFWLNFSEPVRRTGFWLVVLAFGVHTAGLVTRMFLEGRPPVTNLYSSAVFVGWGAVVLGIVLERIFRDGIGTVVSGVIGFTTLIVAHHLSLSGDTMAVLQAVLDTNIWLATHVVIINIGYAATFLAGFLAIIYIIRGMFTRSLTPNVSKALTKMVYGVICFATLFTFVGTILGGIWADQSWGRFWGWDPKENGALLIVLVNAAILHARWGGMIRERGLMACALCGNIVTSWSWFGVNMLGIGLHSYGFMDKAFPWLLGFVISQVVLIALAMLPLHYWTSFKNAKRLSEPIGPAPEAIAAGA